jgi:transcriptional regulator with XRE-family HTH domain
MTFTSSASSDTMRGMGRAGKALRQVLETYGISQNKLAVTMGVERSAVFKWFHEERDPTAETVVDIVQALRSLDAEAAETFINLYLGKSTQGEDLE